MPQYPADFAMSKVRERKTEARKKAQAQRGITRREFLKKAALTGAAIAVGAWGLNDILKRPRLPTVGDEPPAPTQLWKWSKEAYNYVSLGENVRCGLCPNNCTIGPGGRGVCRARANVGGKLYSLVYGNPAAVHLDPVEKKPLFHFLPGSNAFSIGTAGCNFRCLNCQNWQISQFTPEQTENMDMMPQQVVDDAVGQSAKSIAYTYNEPTVFYEYMLDTSRLARQKGLRNIMVSNGYMNREPQDELTKVLDAVHIDLKGFDDNIYMKLNAGTLQPVLDSIKAYHDKGVWFEIIHLAVPTWTDDIDVFKRMVKWLLDNIGPDYPLHISRFSPQYKLTNLPPTPTDYLVKARQAAIDVGLHYVYVGNAPELNMEDTICPKCGKTVLERRGYTILANNLVDSRCKFCGERIPGVWS